MARKQRDYAAEYARRQALARERGYKSYGEQRRKIERGEILALAPKRVKSAKTRARQAVLQSSLTYEQAKAAYVKTGQGKRKRAEEWSRYYSNSYASEYAPKNRPKGMTIDRYTDLYLRTWVEGPETYTVVHNVGGSEDLRYWLVEVAEYYSAEEYDKRYEI